MKIRVKQNSMKAAALIVCICLIITGVLLLLKSWKRQILYQDNASQSGSSGRRISYQDKYYEPKAGLETMLVLGLDEFQHADTDIGYRNNEQADYLMLFILDKNNCKCDMLYLNRDTMTEINRIGVGGGEAGTFTGQLALAHTFGSGGSDSCRNSTRAVSTLLDGVKIEHYLTLTMDAVAKMNDLVGGVEVEILDDFSQVDPALVQGQTVRLAGDQALTYLRSRNGMEDISDLARIKRQQQYMNALYEKTMECSKADPGFIKNVFLTISGSFQSDCTIFQMEKLLSKFKKYTFGPLRTLPGEAVKGEEYMEFYVDEDAKKQTVIDLFYQPCDD